LSTIDQRIIACMGLEYVQGSVNCPDSTPEEEEYQIRMERGETDILNYAPTTMSIEDLCVGTSINNNHVPPTYEENRPSEDMERVEVSGDELSYNDVINVCTERDADENVAPNSQTIGCNLRRTEIIRRNRKQRQRIGVQLQEARENFTDIAEKHAEALKLFAEAAMKMAENDSKRQLLEEKRLELEEKRIAIEGQTNKLLTILLDKIE